MSQFKNQKNEYYKSKTQNINIIVNNSKQKLGTNKDRDE